MIQGNGMPPDPFGFPGGADDLRQFAANCYALHVSLQGAGFGEFQALRLVAELMAALARNPAPERRDS